MGADGGLQNMQRCSAKRRDKTRHPPMVAVFDLPEVPGYVTGTFYAHPQISC